VDDKTILHHITELVEEENRLRAATEAPEQHRARIEELEVQLDQCWDLLPEDSAMLILPGGIGWADDASHHAAIAKAGQFLRRDVPVAAICGATAALARAGWLETRPHTSNALSYLKGTGYGGAELYQDQPVVREGTLITAGGMAPIEFAREIFDLLGIYNDDALQAWEQLYKTGKSEYFARLARAASEVPS
jgi:putative intracellular protease/amidase